MSDVTMTPVESSYLKAIGQDGSTLRIQFKSGKTFDFGDAAHHHGPILQSDSPGRYFHKHIRGNEKHPSTEVTE